jgi:hypothetical protein
MVVEVESNENCEAGAFVRFKEVEAARSITQVRIYDRTSTGEWCWVCGWTDHPTQAAGAAFAQLVEDSGAGLAYLVFGGLHGIRLKPVAIEEEWDVASTRQWGEPYLLLADASDLRYKDVP